MSTLAELFQSLPLQSIANHLGVSSGEASAAVQSVLPALVSGMQANAGDPAGAASLAQALSQHAQAAPAASLDEVDTADGAKIVSHVFGSNEEAVVQRLAGAQGLAGGLIGKLLPLLAPLVMSWLAKSVLSGGAQAPGGGAQASGGEQGGGFLSDLLESVGGPPQAGPAAPAGGFDLGSVLGSVLGGASAQPGGGLDIGSVLGGLLGGGRR